MPASCQELDGKIDANGSRIKLRLEDGLPYYGGTSSVFGWDSSFLFYREVSLKSLAVS